MTAFTAKPDRRPIYRRRAIIALGVLLAILAMAIAWFRNRPQEPQPVAPSQVARADDLSVSFIGCQDYAEGGEAARAMICSLEVRNVGSERRHLALNEIALRKNGRVLGAISIRYHKHIGAGRLVRVTERIDGVDSGQDPDAVMVRLETFRPHSLTFPFVRGGRKDLPLFPYNFGH